MAFSVHNVELDEVLFDLRPYPLSLEDWEEYLRAEQAEENLGFWLDAQKYLQLVMKKKTLVKGKEVELRINKNELSQLRPAEYAKGIVQKWIGPTATVAEVNISDKMRQELVESVNSGGENPVDFEPSQQEVKQMMISGERFTRFVQRQLTQNITTSEATCRFRFGIATLLLWVVIGVLLRIFVEGLPRYGLSVLLVSPFGLSLNYLMSGVSKT